MTNDTYQFPTSFAQRRLWFIDQFESNGAVYNIPGAFRLTGQLDAGALARCLNEIVQRHEILRTTFEAVEGAPAQIVHPKVSIELPVEDLTKLEPVEREAATNRHRADEAQTAFDLSRGPLIRARLLRLSPTEHVLLVTMHHIVSDGWSVGIFAEELTGLYQAFTKEEPSPLPELPIQYADFTLWQREFLHGETLDRQLSFWKRTLGGAEPLNLPTDRPRPDMQSFAGAGLVFAVSGETTRRVRELSLREGVTPFMTLLTVFSVLLGKYSGQEDLCVGTPVAGRNRAEIEGLIGCFINTLTLRVDSAGNPTFRELLQRVRAVTLDAYANQDVPFEQVVEELHPVRDLSRSPLFQVMFILQNTPRTRLRIPGLTFESLGAEIETSKFELTLSFTEAETGLEGIVEYNTDLFDEATIQRLVGHYRTLLESGLEDPDRNVSELTMLTVGERLRILVEWNDTATDYPRDALIHELFEAQVERAPDAVALVFEDQTLTYRELNERADRLAQRLREAGVGPGMLVGLHVERSPETVVTMLGALKSGGAYVPLDPAYPKERIDFIVEDAGLSCMISDSDIWGSGFRVQGSGNACRDFEGFGKLNISGMRTSSDSETPNPEPGTPNPAYVIYTSGSTGKPKGVVVTHRNVVNFFAGMDERVGCTPTDTMLAVTSISFDISVLELLWTLTRGARVVLVSENGVRDIPARVERKQNLSKTDFSLFFFASAQAETAGNAYRLLFEAAKFADRNGFESVWTPERHFHAFGGLYPNPSVMGAALAASTERIGIRAGSVVLPLHHPIRVAEEWALVDNISRGRVGVSFASGWHPNDFVFAPENFTDRKQRMFDGIETVRALWRGNPVKAVGGAGKETEVRILPRPVQPELPFWVTAAGSPETFIQAGKIGANLLTHLLGQSVEEVGENIRLYRRARAEHGHDPDTGRVTLMVHTFIGDDIETVRETVRGPFIEYLRSSAGLIAAMAKSLDPSADIDKLSPEDLDAVLEQAFHRFFDANALFGTPESCLGLVRRFSEIGVDEVACLIDFGVESEKVLDSLPKLNALRESANRAEKGADYSLPALALEHSPTLMQCTPSMMRMLTAHPQAAEFLGSLETLLLGGEALPPALARDVKNLPACRVVNMYGPTETTVWSATHEIEEVGDTVPVGRPIANTQIFILDRHLQPLPVGIPGELHIGGDGVAQGYLNRPELTAERFISNPFFTARDTKEVSTACGSERVSSETHHSSLITHHGLLYRTGDTARYRADGTIEFLGRADNQVKLRGHRIELGEIEAALERHDAVAEAAVVVKTDGGTNKRLAAYVVLKEAESNARDTKEAKDVSTVRGSGRVHSTLITQHLPRLLPSYMIPSSLVVLDSFPTTPNGKIDRKALANMEEMKPEPVEAAAPSTPVEVMLAEVWRETLNVDHIGLEDNFFAVGGDSILSIQVVFKAKQRGILISPKQLFQNPTVAALARVAEVQSGTFGQSETVTGDVPLTPIQHWFFEQNLADPHHYNHALLLTAPSDLDAGAMRRAVESLLVHHDALRTRFVRIGDAWKQTVAAPNETIPFERFDLSALAPPERTARLESTAAGLQASLDLERGPLARVAWFDFGKDEPGRLLLVIHHLVVDGVSWRIILDDLQTAYFQASRGETPSLPPKSVSFKRWAETLVDAGARNRELRSEVDFWPAQTRGTVELPTDFSAAGATLETARTVSRSLGAEQTRLLLHDVPPVHHTRINDALLAALLGAFRERTGTKELLVELEGHGRDADFADLDTSRTVGWFTAMYPVRLSVENVEDAGATLRTVKELLRGIPGNGVGYGVLKYLHPEAEIRNRLRNQPKAGVMFNYLGQFDSALGENAVFGPAPESVGPTRSLRGRLGHDIEINAMVTNGELRAEWTFNTATHRVETVEGLAESFVRRLERIIEHCLNSDAGGFTPSDFPLADLDDQNLEDLAALLHEIDA